MQTVITRAHEAIVVSGKKRPITLISDFVTEILPKLIWEKEALPLFYAEVLSLINDPLAIESLDNIYNENDLQVKALALLDLKMIDASMYHNELSTIPKLSDYISTFAKHLNLPLVLTYEELIMTNPIADMRTFSPESKRYPEILFYVAHSTYETFAEKMIATLKQVIVLKDADLSEELLSEFKHNTHQARACAMSLTNDKLDKESFVNFRKFLAVRPDLDCLGPSGAFTATIPVIDLLYSGNHLPKERLQFYSDKLMYYPRDWHQTITNALEHIENKTWIDIVDLSSNSNSCQSLSELCSTFLLSFRKGHYKMVTQHLPDVANDQAPGTMGGEKPGTFLKKRIMETEEVHKEKPLILTGIRPTSNLTIANYIGAIKPILDFQEQGLEPFVFVADIHALTDNEPGVLKYGDEILIDFLASGIDPKRTTIYKQSDIAGEISLLTLLLARHISVSELTRLPTLKDKVKSDDVDNANALLLMYPVMMTADILIQRSSIIPVGKDQESHIEIARKIARRFNKDVSSIFPEPQTHIMEMVKILSLRGTSKMSKSIPEDAIFLTDDLKMIKKKINRAQTANPGEMTDSLQSHMTLIRNICNDEIRLKNMDLIITRHMNNETVMKEFKDLFCTIVYDFVSKFQTKREDIIQNKDQYLSELKEGSKKAIERAQETIELVYKSFKL